MQHSLIREKNEKVKIFSHKDPNLVRKTIKIFTFSGNGLEDITPPIQPTISDLNIGYYSAEITTPNKHCYLLILFCGNPIVLRVGLPPIQFIYWGKINSSIPYKHFDEFGVLKSEGTLLSLNYGFYYYTPVEETLGYIEVNDTPYILNVPYKCNTAGIGIDVDWQKVIVRQRFGIKTKQKRFKLNSINPVEFSLGTDKYKFTVKKKISKFNLKTIKKHFNVYCR